MKLSFEISGDFITEHLRSCFLERDFNSVCQMYEDTFGNLNLEVLISILKCENKFEGINELFLKEDNVLFEENVEYLNEIDHRYNNLYKDHDGFYYRGLYKVVLITDGVSSKYAKREFNKNDLRYNEEINLDGKFYSFDELRVLYICDNFNCKVLKYKNEFYLLENIEYQIPYWFKSYTDIKKYIEHNKKKFHIINDITEQEYIRNKYNIINDEPNLEDIKNKILEKCKSFIKLEYEINGEKHFIDIPEEPFILWGLRYKKRYFIDNEIYTWAPICKSGYKMINDDPYHSDWIIGANLDIENYYELVDTNPIYKAINDAAWQKAFDISLDLTTKYNLDENDYI